MNTSVNILGLSHSHDSGVALLRGGKLVAAVNEERLSRRKHDGSFPEKSLTWLLSRGGIDPKEIDVVALAGRHLASYPSLNNDLSEEDGRYRPAVAMAEFFDRMPGGASLFMHPWSVDLYRRAQSLVGGLKLAEYRRTLRGFGITAPVRLYDHHDCHLATAYYTSGQADPCLLISNDGFGDGLCAKVAIGRDGRLHDISSNSFYNSLGILYGYATDICGFPRIWHAGKTTGLAARGDWRRTYPVFREAMAWNDDLGRYQSRIGLFRRGQHWLSKCLAGASREDVAAGVQRLTEDLLAMQLRWLRHRTGLDHVAVAGGVHANVRANQVMASEHGLKSFFVFPHMGDGGLALGAAAVARAKTGERAGSQLRMPSRRRAAKWHQIARWPNVWRKTRARLARRIAVCNQAGTMRRSLRSS